MKGTWNKMCFFISGFKKIFVVSLFLFLQCGLFRNAFAFTSKVHEIHLHGYSPISSKLRSRSKTKLDISNMKGSMNLSSILRRERVIGNKWKLHSTATNNDKSLNPETLLAEGVSAFTTFLSYYSKSFTTYNEKNTNQETIQSIVQEIMDICQKLESMTSSPMESSDLILRAMRYGRYSLLQRLMRMDYDAYVNVASFLSPITIPREELPNLQDIPYTNVTPEQKKEFELNSLDPSVVINKSRDESMGRNKSVPLSADEEPLVPDCTLPTEKFQDNPLDSLLLFIFRKLVAENSGGVAVSNQAGISGLLEQGRIFMLQPNQTPEAQHKMVRDTLRGLMTPFLPPFFRLFMSGIIPQKVVNYVRTKLLKDERKYNEEVQLGPWFYAPYLTTIVTPLFFQFLVGPSKPNARKDGAAGGLIVQKCKFLQESNCKGLCLHQCKLPAQQFFQNELGLPLTVSPNFETQECQWSFGEVPKSPSEDESFPKGCLIGCESRSLMAGSLADSDGSLTVEKKKLIEIVDDLNTSEDTLTVELNEAFDISIPYDAAAKLAYDESDKSMNYGDFKTNYEAEAVKMVKSKQPIDVSIPYDAAAKLAYEESDKSMTFNDFEKKYVEEAIKAVIQKRS